MPKNPHRITRRNLISTGAALTASAALHRTGFAQTPAASPAATSYPLTVTHDGGDTTLESQPQRIVALEWNLVEDLLVLGIQPVAIADVEGFKTWVTIDVPLADDVQDVGTRQEPSLEALEAAEPDLILGVEYRDITIYDSLTAVAPTILVPAYPQDAGITPLQYVRDRLRNEGWFLDHAAAAEQAIAAMDSTIAEKASAIEAAGLTGAPYVVTQAFSGDNQPAMRIFSDKSLLGDSISATGLENAWTAEGDEWGFTTNTVESFVELPDDVHVFYIINDSDDVFENYLKDDPIWQSLPFMREGRFYPLGGDTWAFGSTQSVERIVTKSTGQITGTADE